MISPRSSLAPVDELQRSWLTLFRIWPAFFALLIPSALLAEPIDIADIQKRAAALYETETALNAARLSAPECEEGCSTPSETVALAYAAGEGKPTAGRFLLDVSGGGQSLTGELGDLFFVNSQLGYARFGTVTIALERDALWALLRRARVCDGGLTDDGQIEVRACHQVAPSELDMFTMMRALGNKRIVVEGEARLVWIDARTGLPRPLANKRGENELGYYQVWVRVADADQVIFVYGE